MLPKETYYDIFCYIFKSIEIVEEGFIMWSAYMVLCILLNRNLFHGYKSQATDDMYLIIKSDIHFDSVLYWGSQRQ